MSDALANFSDDEKQQLAQYSPAIASMVNPPKPPPGPQGPTPSAGGAMGAIKRGGKEVKALHEDTRSAFDEYRNEQEAAINMAAGVELQKSAANAKHQAAEAVMAEENAAALGEYQNRAKGLFEEQRVNLDRAAELAQMRSTPEEYDHHKSIIDSAFTTEDQKQNSREWMQKQKKIEIGGPKVMALIVMSLLGNTKLGGIANALSGLIDRDIAAQKEAFRRNRLSLGETGKYYQKMFDALGDERAAGLATHKAALQSAQQKLEAETSKLGDQDVAAKAQDELAKLAEKEFKVDAELNEHLANNAQSRMASEVGVRERLGQQRFAAQAAEVAASQKAEKQAKLIGSADVRAIGSIDAGLAAIDELEAAFNDETGPLSGVTQYWPGNESIDLLPGSEPVKYQGKRASTTQLVGGILEGGKLADADYGRYYDMHPAPGDSKALAKSKFDQLRHLLKTSKKAGIGAFKDAGYSPGNLEEPPDPAAERRSRLKDG